MSCPNDIIALAKQELGYCEKASNYNLDSKTGNAGSNNYTKYARDLYNNGYYNGNKQSYAWCDVFVDWLFFKAYGKDEGQRIECQTGDLGAGTPYSAGYYKAQGRYDKTPKVGDQIFFQTNGNITHTGIVTEVGATTIKTIEGNTSNMVKEHSYNKNDGYIAGYGHPKYSEESTSAATPSTTTKINCKGIDVSVWNGTINWSKVKTAGIDFAIIRAGYGKNNIDTQFKNNTKGALAAGVDVGFYWFSYAVNPTEAKAEADYLCDAIESLGIKPTYPLCYDYEYDSIEKAKAKGYNPSSADIVAMAKAFLNEVEARGYYAANYTNIDFLSRGFSQLVDRYDTWLAQWNVSAPSRTCGLWQYTDKGSVSGISGVVDMDLALYDYPTIIKKMYGDTTSNPVHTPTEAELFPYGRASNTTGYISKGCIGNDVKAIQWALNKLGFGNKGTIDCDGEFRNKTKSAVKEFQKKAFPNTKSEWDGVVGNNTRTAFKQYGY